MKRFVKLNKEYSDLGEIVKVYEQYRDMIENLASSKEMLSQTDDDEMKDITDKATKMTTRTMGGRTLRMQNAKSTMTVIFSFVCIIYVHSFHFKAGEI